MESRYELIYPPKGIFLYEDWATWDWSPKDLGLGNSSRIEWPVEGGIAFYPREQRHPFPGFPFPPAIDNIAIFKRFILNRIKRPWRFIFWKEIDEMILVSVRRYFLKPKFYARPIREMYRLAKLVCPDNEKWNDRIHAVCAIFQWDPAYRYRIQLILAQIQKRFGMRKSVNMVLSAAQSFDDNVAVQKKYRAVKLLWNIALFWPPFYKKAKVVFNAMRNDQMALTEADQAFAFSKITVVPVTKK